MTPILKIKNENGQWVEVPAIKGEPGYTPVKGTDYYTESEKQEIISAVIAALPKYDGGVT